jgi:hypothetical protein
MPRNSKRLTICEGVIGHENVLQTLSDMTGDLVDTSILSCVFPFPQLFVCISMILVFTQTSVYELESGVLNLKLTVPGGSTWSLVDFYNFIYASNGVVSVIRDGLSSEWSISSTLPIANAVCNFNGQVVVGYPKEL